MAANPISYQELEAFCRSRLVTLSAWEIELLMRLDDTVLAIWAEKSAKTTAGQGDPIPVTNTEGVRGLFQDLKARKAAA